MSSNLNKSSCGFGSPLIWRQPMAIWLVPTVLLFAVTTIPTLTVGGGMPSNATIFVSELILIVMGFIMAHRLFGHLHHRDQSDVYFAMPTSRTAFFFGQHAAAFVYLVVPHLLFVGINSLIWAIRMPPEVKYMLGDFWIRYVATLLVLMHFFLFLEIFYLASDRTGHAVMLFLLINLAWPALILIVNDMMTKFLPGFISPFMDVYGAEPWTEGLIQLLSPLAGLIYVKDVLVAWVAPALLTVLNFVIAYALAHHRRAEGAPLLGNAPVTIHIAEWIGVIAVALGGGYATYYLRRLVDRTSRDGTAAPAPGAFLIGVVIGLIVSLWIFNLIRNKARFHWRSLLPSAAATAIPLAVFIAILMTGAFGYTSNLPPADRLEAVDIRYERIDWWGFGGRHDMSKTITLTNPDELHDFAAMYAQAVDAENPGVQLPRTPASVELQQTDKHHGKRHFTVTSTDNKTRRRALCLPTSLANAHYVALLDRQPRFRYMEIAYGLLDAPSPNVDILIERADDIPDEAVSQADFLDTMLHNDDAPYDFYDWVLLLRSAAYDLSSFGDDDLASLEHNAPIHIVVTVEEYDEGTLRGSYTTRFPIDPERMPQTQKMLWDLYGLMDEIAQDEARAVGDQ